MMLLLYDLSQRCKSLAPVLEEDPIGFAEIENKY